MVLDAVSNFVRGNTDAEVGTEDTTVSVDDASIFPDPETDGEFNVVIWDANNFPRPDQDSDVEIMRVTARDTDTNELTVTRGQEMTSAAAHPEGSAIHLSPTAKMFSDIESTFGDFWDAGTQELTADVNNTNTTTTALEAEDLAVDGKNSDFHLEKVDEFDTDGDTGELTIDFGGSLGADDFVWIMFARLEKQSNAGKIFGEVDADVDPYGWELQDGTAESNEDEWVIADASDTDDRSQGMIEISRGDRPRINNISLSVGRWDKSTHIKRGGSDGFGNPSELTLTEDADAGDDGDGFRAAGTVLRGVR